MQTCLREPVDRILMVVIRRTVPTASLTRVIQKVGTLERVVSCFTSTAIILLVVINTRFSCCEDKTDETNTNTVDVASRLDEIEKTVESRLHGMEKILLSIVDKVTAGSAAGTIPVPVPGHVETVPTSGLTATTITDGSSLVISREDQLLIMKRKKEEDELKQQLNKFVKEVTFRKVKFPYVTAERSRKECLKAVDSGVVKLPPGVEADVFADLFHNKIKERLRVLRNNCHNSAISKFKRKFLTQGGV